MNALEALRLANSSGSEAMLHASTLAKRRAVVGEAIGTTWHPAVIVGVGFAAGALFGRVVASHPKLSGAGAFLLAMLRTAPHETLWRMWGFGPDEAPPA